MKAMNKFRQLRLNAGIKTVKEAAKKLKCSPSMVYAMEQGARMPGRKLAIRMCKVYKCYLEDIFLSENHTNRVIEDNEKTA